jgi:phthiocerol/phenolphthiocerol synthesis type-I polyketide synthase E
MPQEIDQLDRIAVIGMAGRFPGAPNLEQFWKNLCDGMESVTNFSDEQLAAAGVDPEIVRSPHYVKTGILLDGVDMFDPQFFGFTPREAALTDPQHRLFLECAWEALEDAGYDPDRTKLRIGVFAGAGTNLYSLYNVFTNPELMASLNYLQMTIASRL